MSNYSASAGRATEAHAQAVWPDGGRRAIGRGEEDELRALARTSGSFALDAVMIGMLPRFADPVDVGDTRSNSSRSSTRWSSNWRRRR